MALPIVAANTILLSSPGMTLELRWSTGAADLAVTASQPCTLLVRASSGEQLPTHWFLNWVGNLDLNAALAARTPGEDAADVCRVADSLTAGDRVTHRTVVQHCGPGAERMRVARYILPADGGSRLRVELVTERPPGLDTQAGAFEVASEATLNGGGTLRCRALVSGAVWNAATNSVQVEGLHLDAVRRATCVPRNEVVALPLPVKNAGGAALTVSLPARLRAGELHIFDGRDLVAVTDFAANDPSAPDAASPDRVIAWFAPGAVREIPAFTTTALEGYTFDPPSLRGQLGDAGAVALERLFPKFLHESAHTLNSLGEPVSLTDLADMYILQVAPGVDEASATALISSLEGVWYCMQEPDNVAWPTGIGEDPLYTDQWALHVISHPVCNGQYQAPGISAKLDAAWPIATGRGVEIGILDSRIETEHLDLSNASLYGCYTSNCGCPPFCSGDGHATAVAGIAAAVRGNATGVAGVAGGADGDNYANLSGYTVCDGDCPPVPVQRALEDAREVFELLGSPQVLNLSFGGPIQPGPSYVGALKNNFLAGQLVVASIGNGNDGLKVYPAALKPMACAVGALYMNGFRWRDEDINITQPGPGSTFGPWIDLCAPGGRAIVAPGPQHSVDPNDAYYLVDDANCTPANVQDMGFGGTSAAAPVISGVAALLKQYERAVTGEDMQAIMQLTALDITFHGVGWDVHTGSGLVQADAALGFITPPRQLRHGDIGYLGHQGTMAIVDSLTGYQQRTFKYVPGLASTETAWCRWYRLRGQGFFQMGYRRPPNVWVRQSGTMGWRDSTVIDNLGDVPWARVVPNSVIFPYFKADFETYVYKIVDNPTSQNLLAWFPDAPERARVAFTSVGETSFNVGVGASQPGAGDGMLRAANNPARGGVTLIVGSGTGRPATVEVFDVAGRLVARLTTAVGADGPQTTRWDGTSIRGFRCGPGTYLARATWNGGGARCRFVLLR